MAIESDLIYRHFDEHEDELAVGFECGSCYCDNFFTGDDDDYQDATGRKVTNGKVYSPETCSFIDLLTNNFITDSKKRRGKFMLGVSRRIDAKLYGSRCSNPLTSKLEFLGSFKTESEAHCAWRHRKHEISCESSELQSDTRIKEALKTRYIQELS